MPSTRKKINRQASSCITPEVIRLYKAGDRAGLHKALGLSQDADRSPLDPQDGSHNLLACGPDTIKKAEIIRARIEEKIAAEGG